MANIRNIKEKICQHFHWNSQFWEITDIIPPLAMCHYVDACDKKICGTLKGVIIDIETLEIVADAFGYSETVNVNAIPTDMDGKITLCQRTYDPGELLFYPVLNGIMIRTFKYKGKVWVTTQRKLDISRSKWGSDKTFLELYTLAKGNMNFFEGVPEDTCNRVFFFMLIDQDMITSMKFTCLKPFLVLVLDQLMSYKHVKYFDYRKYEVKFTLSNRLTMFEKYGGPGIMPAKHLSITEANRYLKYGHLQNTDELDELKLYTCMYPGESVMVRTKTDSHFTSYMITPDSVTWRKMLRNVENSESRNPLRAFFHHANFLKFTNSRMGEFLFDVVVPDISEYDKCIFYMKLKPRSRETFADRLRLLADNMSLALPKQFQKICLNYPEIFYNGKKKIERLCEQSLHGQLKISEMVTQQDKFPQFDAAMKDLLRKIKILYQKTIKEKLPQKEIIHRTVNELNFDKLYQMVKFSDYL